MSCASRPIRLVAKQAPGRPTRRLQLPFPGFGSPAPGFVCRVAPERPVPVSLPVVAGTYAAEPAEREHRREEGQRGQRVETGLKEGFAPGDAIDSGFHAL